MEAFYQNGQVSIYHADVLDWALDYKKQIDAGKALPFMAVISDPPYGLGSPPPIEDLLRHWLDDKDYETGVGFMSKNWDQVVHPKYWRALCNVTLPGGYLFCFSGTRTADLLGIACRLGGWEPFDRIASFAWVQAQGMGKGANISKKLDASEIVPCPDCDGSGCGACGGSGEVVGVEREVVGSTGRDPKRFIKFKEQDGCKRNPTNEDITAPATPLAQAFDGYNTQLAPKHEPVLLFRKPREGRTFAQCAREFGSGGLWVDGCRVGSIVETWPTSRSYASGSFEPGYSGDKQKTNEAPAGRWPPNTHFSHVPPTLCPTCNGAGCDDCHGEGVVGGCRRVGSKRVRGIHTGSSTSAGWQTSLVCGKPRNDFESDARYADPDGLETVADWECVEGCPVAALDEMAGERPSSARPKSAGKYYSNERTIYSKVKDSEHNSLHFDSGSVSRYYPNHDWSLEIAERLAGETPFKYCAKASSSERSFGLAQFLPRTRNERKRRHQDLDGSWLERAVCRHPTVKPLLLLIWLCTLAKPPDIFKPRICIPFSGVMSEGIAARLAGWHEIHAIEREKIYCVWGTARYKGMDKWAALTGKTDPNEIRRLAESAEAKEAWQGDERQMSMFEVLE